MSREVKENILQEIFASHSHNENSNTEESPTDDMKISGSKNQTDEEMLLAREEGSENVSAKDNMATETVNPCGEVDNKLVEKVAHMHISKDEAVSSEPTVSEGTSQQKKNTLCMLKKYKDLSDSSDNEDNTNITLKGLRLGNSGNDDDLEDSDEVSESDSDDYDSEDETLMKELNDLQIKKRKVVHESALMAVLGIDKVTEPPHISTLELNNKEEFAHMGYLDCVIEKIVTVRGLLGMPAYDLDTLLFVDEGQRVLGYVLDVMGPVTAPVYIIPMSSAEAIRDMGLQNGTMVYVAPKTKYTKYVLLQELMKIRANAPFGDRELPPVLRLTYDYLDRQGETIGNVSKRMCSQERHRQYEKDMNRANERDTRLHKMADSHQLHVERIANNNKQPARDSRPRNPSSSDSRPSRPLHRNTTQITQGVHLNDRYTWKSTIPRATCNPNGIPIVDPRFVGAVPPLNSPFQNSSSEQYAALYDYVAPQNSISASSEVQVRGTEWWPNLPGPSNEGWYN